MEHRLGTVIDAALEADCELPPGDWSWWKSKDCDVVSASVSDWQTCRRLERISRSLAVPLNLQRHPPHCKLVL